MSFVEPRRGGKISHGEKPDNIVLRYLRKLDDKLDRLDGRVQEMTAEMRSLVTPMAAFRRSEVAQDSSIAAIFSRLDRIERRLYLSS